MDKNQQYQQNSSSKYMDFKVPVSNVNHIKPRNLQKSTTLMRNGVKSSLTSTNSIKTVSNAIANEQVQDINNVVPNETKLDGYIHNRHPRPYKIPRSELINRFSSTAHNEEDATILQEAVVPTLNENVAPEETEVSKFDSSLDNSPNISNSTVSKNIFEEALKIAPVPEQIETIKYSKPVKNKIKRKRSKKFPVLASSLSMIVIALIAGGIYITHNFDRISIYMASSRAGFKPTISSYNPSGFNLSSVSSTTGIIESSFKSNSDSRTYSIIEKKSNWTSNDLLSNYVINRAGLNYQTISVNGNTIYTYNGNSLATWVHNGLWYIIQDNNSLSTQQIIEIASSM